MDKLDRLRKQAEELLQSTFAEDLDPAALSADELAALVHELRVHQIELEMQNHELRRTQNELEESQRRYAELYEFAPAGYFTLDQRGVVRAVNLTGARLLSKQRSLVVNVPFQQFVHPNDLHLFQNHVNQVLQNQSRHTCEVRLKKSGGEIFVRLESIGSKDADGKVTACPMIVTDLTDRRAAEQALATSEERFRSISESSEDIIFIKDESHRFVYANSAAAKFFACPASELVGRRWTEVYGAELAEYERELDTRVFAGDVVEEEHGRLVGGASRIFLETRAPMRDRSGKVTGILFFARDITDRKLKEFAPKKGPTDYPSRAMQATLKLATTAAKKNSTILLLGESGSGKDHLATYIHNHSQRANGPYFSINCAALAPELAESELFGHEKGSFTGALNKKRGLLELAEGGTLLLNEIGELSLPLQSKLLTFLDTRKFTRVGGEKEISVNARLIAATNRSLEQEVSAGRFRGDLFYRLNVFPITVPPLRERREDIPLIIREVLQQIQKELQVPQVSPIDDKMMEALMNYNWPGNVRELRNVLERALMLSGHEKITLQGLGISAAESSGPPEWFTTTKFPSGESLNNLLDDLKKALINEALHRTRGNRQAAARLLGISRYSLKHYMKTLHIVDEE